MGAVALFFARRPFQAARAGDGRVRVAAVALAGLAVMAAGGFAWGVWQAPAATGLTLLAALPVGAAFAWFDRRKAGRAMAAELCGALFFAALATAIVGAAARSSTSILAIRAFLRARKGATISPVPAIAAAASAVTAFGAYAACAAHWVPAAWCGVFLLRAAWLLGPRAPDWTARRLGMMEAVLGLVAIITTGFSFQ
jgi:hypothetical protein